MKHSWLLLLAFLVGVVPLNAQGIGRVVVDDEIATAPVSLDGVVLFRVRGTSSFPAQDRALAIQERIVGVASDATIPVDAVRAVEDADMTRIVGGDSPIMTVVDADAALERLSRITLAWAHASRIRQAIDGYRAARTPAALGRAGMNTLLATALLAVAILVVLWLWRRLDALLQHRLQARIKSVGIQSFEVMRADRIWAAVRSASLGLRTLVFFAVAFVYAGFVLGQWPWTRAASQGLVGLALAPLQVLASGFAANFPSLVFLAVLFFLVRILLRLTRLFFEAVGQGTVTLGGFDAEWAYPTYKLLRIAVIALGLVVAYPYIPGSDSAAFKGVSLFMGIVFSLGSSTAISNIIAGYMMTYRRAFKVGDRVKIGDAVGEVIEMRLQVTHLRSFKNEELVIPNSEILAGTVLNYTSLAKTQGLILHTDVGIGYETSWRQVEAMLLVAADRTAGLGPRRPFVLMKQLGDFAVTYELNVFCEDPRAMIMHVYTQLHENILDVFNEHGVQIMTPAYEGDPAEPKVVPPKDWYVAPATPVAAVSKGQLEPR